MIEVIDLCKNYGNNAAVKNISFTVEKGKIYGLLGPNGAGKSTTMNIITGCLAATSGKVLVSGHDIFEEPIQAKQLIGYLPEHPPLYSDFTPDEYLRFVAEAKGIASSDIDAEIDNVIEKTQIDDVRNRLIRNLSKGYKQRVGIAQAMLGSPEIIILDEPTVGLDPKQIIEIRSLIKSLSEEHTVIISSHILSEISEVCDHVIIIAHGTIIAQDTIYNLQNLFAGTENLSLTAKGDYDRIRMILNETEGIDKYTLAQSKEQLKGLFDAEIKVKSGLDIREALFNAFSEDKIPLLKLSSDALSLEDIFLRLTSDENSADEIKETFSKRLQTEPASQAEPESNGNKIDGVKAESLKEQPRKAETKAGAESEAEVKSETDAKAESTQDDKRGTDNSGKKAKEKVSGNSDDDDYKPLFS